ncbi:TolC family protein [Massilia sp. Leaf139]|uniref:TolC family protein n=1 Tax=Massilia sp. Leaf139 TaxID=1736272 RepID=UPI0006F6209D|nr:TolC family protein [Massilia sp. Leaf139]KQQ89223.1 RND transporter [Massilia sp. Leaf139]
MSARPQAPRAGALAVLALLAGCAGVTPDGGFDAVATQARARDGLEPRIVTNDADASAVAETTRALLAQPLDTDAAVRIALLNHPGLQASYWNVGIAQADLAQAARLQNPAFGFKRMAGGGDVEIERSLGFNLAQVLTMPLARRMEARRFEQVKLAVGAEIERHALEVRRAWIDAVAARQGLDYARRVHAAHDASAELMGRMARSGNASQLDLARERTFQAEAGAAVVRAERQALKERERLTRLLGLWGADTAFRLPERLPDLPAAPGDIAQIEARALERRLDVAAARQDSAALAASLGLTRTTRFVNVLELGVERKRESGMPEARGYEVSIELPLFDWGGAKHARAEALYMQSLRRVADTAVNARSQARERYLGYRAAWDLARLYRDEVIPLRKRISDETLLRYNGMLASSFELLADAREQAGAVNAAIDALKDFWNAHADLEEALGGAVVHTAPPAAAAPEQHKEHAQ